MLTLCYHKISNSGNDWNMITTSTKSFREQLEYIKESIGFLSVDDVINGNTTHKVLLTFDDGYEDNYFNVLPVIEELQIPAVFFISTETLFSKSETWCNELVRLLYEGDAYPHHLKFLIDGNDCILNTYTMQERIESYKQIRSELIGADLQTRNLILEQIRCCITEQNARTTHFMLNADQLIQLSKSQYVTIGCHTVTHRSLALLPINEQYKEIADSKATLERLIKKKVCHFAYPFGGISDYSTQTINILRDLGFLSAFSTTYKRHCKMKGQYEIPRVCIHECSLDDFKNTIEIALEKKSYWASKQ